MTAHDQGLPLVLMGGTAAGGGQAPAPYSAILAAGQRALSAALGRRLTDLGARVETVAAESGGAAASPFHWGRWFASPARRAVASSSREGRPVSGIGWSGPGAMALLGDEGLRSILGAEPGEVVANNRFSADAFMVAPHPGAAKALTVDRVIDGLATCPTDNAAPRCLEEAGFRSRDIADQPFARFDVDTPLDLALLALAVALSEDRRLDPEVVAFLAAARQPGGRALEVPHLAEVGAVMRDRRGQLVVAGRVPARTVQLLEAETACRVRWFIEERGMRSARGERPRSLLARWIDERGAASLVNELAGLGDAVILDSRVVMAAIAGSAESDRWPPAEERFAADFGDAGLVGTPWLREMLDAVAASSVPFLIGSHTLVSDGLHLLVEAAWAGR